MPTIRPGAPPKAPATSRDTTPATPTATAPTPSADPTSTTTAWAASTARTARVSPVSLTNPNDWHVPTLREVFTLAMKFPNKPIFLDTKLPPNQPDVARRMAQQYMALFREFPALKERAFVASPDEQMLSVMKAEFKKTPGFEAFKNFAFDHEDLSNFVLGHRVEEAAPLRGAGDNRWLSVGAPYKPLSVGDWKDVLELTRRTLAQTRDPNNPNFGKPLCVWTIDDEQRMRDLAAIGPDYILTDHPALLHRVLDERYGPAGVDPKRPKVMAHRGGPDGSGAPENTLPMIERGFRAADAIEIDVCSATDGQVVFHDNDPTSALSLLRQSGAAVGEFKPRVGTEGGDVSKKRLDQLSIADIQRHYRFERDEKGAVANVESTFELAGRFAGKLIP